MRPGSIAGLEILVSQRSMIGSADGLGLESLVNHGRIGNSAFVSVRKSRFPLAGLTKSLRGLCRHGHRRTRLGEARQTVEIKAFIDALSPEQQQIAFDLLWQRMAADPRQLTSPAWHGEVLAHRTENLSDSPSLSLPDAMAAVRQMVDERRNSK